MHLRNTMCACSGVVQQATCQMGSCVCCQAVAGSVCARFCNRCQLGDTSADHATVPVKLQTHCWSVFLPTDLSTLRKISQGRMVMGSSSVDMQSVLEMIWQQRSSGSSCSSQASSRRGLPGQQLPVSCLLRANICLGYIRHTRLL